MAGTEFKSIIGLRKDTAYSKQLSSLKDIEVSLRNMISFVHVQKKSLEEKQSILLELEEEEQKYKPILEAKRKLIEVIFDIQEEKAFERIWINRTISFFSGILTSIIAAYLYNKFIRKPKN